MSMQYGRGYHEAVSWLKPSHRRLLAVMRRTETWPKRLKWLFTITDTNEEMYVKS